MPTHRYSPPGESPEPWKSSKLFREEADIADRLPGPAAQKLRKLRDAAESARALVSVPYLTMKEANAQRVALQSRIDELVGRRQLRDNDPLVVSERDTLTKLTEKSKALSAEAEARRERASQLAHLVRACEEYAEALPRSRPIDLAPAVPAPKATKPIGEMVGAIRERLDRHRKEIAAAINAPVPAAEAKRRAAAFVQGMAANGAPDVIGLLEGGAIEFPMVDTGPVAVASNRGAGFAQGTRQVDTLAVFAWLHRDQLIAALHAEIDDNADDAGALSDKDRADKIAKAKAAMLADERAEETLITLGEAQGLNILRRENADPRAVLGLADSAPPPAGE